MSEAERLDQHVVGLSLGFSRASAAKLITGGNVSINGKIEIKPSAKVNPGDKVKVHYEQAKIPEIELPILYEDKDCVVIDKPPGILTHSKGAFNPEATVATWLAPKFKGLAGERAGIVHRLDRATSGVMIMAKSPEALSWLQKQFSLRKVKKSYVAVAEGVFKQPEAVIDMPIERNPKKPQTFRVGSNGKPALTEYKVIKQGKKSALVELRPQTGRTHQLRVHLAHIGHPILGDVLYGDPGSGRLYLHAQMLEITLPNRKREVFEALVPEEFAGAVK